MRAREAAHWTCGARRGSTLVGCASPKIKPTRTHPIGSHRILFPQAGNSSVSRARVRAQFLKASPEVLEWSSTRVKCPVPPEAVKGFCEMISKSVQPILRFAHVGALRHGPLFCGNRPLGAPQRHGAFESRDGRPPQGKDKAPLDVRRGALHEYYRRS